MPYQDSVIDIGQWEEFLNIRKDEAIPVIAKQIEQVLYTSFKDECREDDDYHHALTRIWSTMYNFQTRCETNREASS